MSGKIGLDNNIPDSAIEEMEKMIEVAESMFGTAEEDKKDDRAEVDAAKIKEMEELIEVVESMSGTAEEDKKDDRAEVDMAKIEEMIEIAESMSGDQS